MADEGGPSLSIAALRAMLNANSPEDVARHGQEWRGLARELYDAAYDLDGSLADLDEVFDSRHAAPALKAQLAQALRDLDVTAGRLDRNGGLLEQAASALDRARDEANNAPDDGESNERAAGAIAKALSEEHANIAAQLDTFANDDGYRPGSGGDEAGSGADGGSSGSGTRSSPGGGGVVPTVGTPGASSSSAGRFNPGPTLGGRTTVPGGKLGSDSGRSVNTGTGARGGIGAGAAGATAARAGKVGVPGPRSGLPIGGYRPAIGSPGSGGATPPGGAGPGKAGGPGGPGRPGMAPPGGTGPGQPGKDRPGKRLTNYEKVDPDTFRDTRHRVKPVIGEQRRQPDAFKPTPGAIGGKQTTEETPALPDLPTAEAPARFEGHDVSVSFTRRTRGSQ